MRSPQLITVALGILLIIVLYTIPRRTPERITRYDEWLDTAMFRMPGDQLASLEETLDQLKSEKDGNRRANIYGDLAMRFKGKEWPQLHAEYLRLKAESAEPQTGELWAESGDAFLATLEQRSWEEGVVVDLGMHALYSYERALEFDSTRIDWKLGLSQCYTDYQGNVMQGVFLLRDIAAEVPNHPEANLRLGRFALMSGQIDRAKIRFATALEGDSLNLQARIMLAEVLAGTGDPEEAREILGAGSRMFSDSSSLEQLRTAIDKFSQ